MLNVVVPMAGRGRRFAEAGYLLPKPFIRIGDKPMIEHVIDNVRPKREHRFIFLVQADALRFLDSAFAGATIVAVPDVTEGAACTVLLAKHIIDTSDPLLIVNSDQIIQWDVDRFLDHASHYYGCIATFDSRAPQYSYAALDESGYVVEVAEKRVISRDATAGAYFWQHGYDFCACAEMMIAAEKRTNGEFYVAPVYNELNGRACGVTTYHVPCVDSLGTPEDLTAFRVKMGLVPVESV